MPDRTSVLSLCWLPGLLVAGMACAQSPEPPTGLRIVAGPEVVRPSRDAADLAVAESAVVERTNSFREGRNLPALDTEAELAQAARSLAAFMARTGRYGHQADGKTPAQRAREQGYAYCLISENIAYQFDSSGFAARELAAELVRGWEESPGHRKNMLDPDATDIGVAISRSGESGYYYAVQVFGRPETARVDFELSNDTQASVRYSVGDQSFDLRPGSTRTHGLCRPEPVRFRWAEQQGETEVRPVDGERFRILRSGGRLEVERH